LSTLSLKCSPIRSRYSLSRAEGSRGWETADKEKKEKREKEGGKRGGKERRAGQYRPTARHELFCVLTACKINAIKYRWLTGAIVAKGVGGSEASGTLAGHDGRFTRREHATAALLRKLVDQTPAGNAV